MMTKYAGIFTLISLGAVGVIFAGVYSGALGSVDAFFQTLSRSLETPWRTSFFTAVTFFGSLWFILPGSAALVLSFAARRQWERSITVGFAIGASLVSGFFLKGFLQVPRPEQGLIPSPLDGSFPSGHTLLATVFFGALIYALSRNPASRRYRFLSASGAALMILLVAASRVYLGAHWLSDVLAGLALGLFWLTLAILLKRKWVRARTKKTGASAVPGV